MKPNLSFLVGMIRENPKEAEPKSIFREDIQIRAGLISKSSSLHEEFEYIREAVDHYEGLQFFRDAFTHFVKQDFFPKTSNAYGEWYSCVTQLYVPKSYSRTLLTERTPAKVVYLERDLPNYKSPEIRADVFSNQRHFSLVIAVNRDQSPYALHRWFASDLLPELKKLYFFLAHADIRAAGLAPDELNALILSSGRDYRDERGFERAYKLLTKDARKQTQGKRDLGRATLQTKLLAIACYRFAQAGYDHDDYNKEMSLLGIPDKCMDAKSFRKRVLRVAELVLSDARKHFGTNLHNIIESKGIHFPEMLNLWLKTKLISHA